MLIIEYFLWRTRSEYAISNHYERHCVWEEVLRNKRLNKYNHTAIDEQFAVYQSDGLTVFDPEDPSTPLPSCASWCLFSVWMHLILFHFLWKLDANLLNQLALQMFLKVLLLFVPIHQCQIYFHVSGLMRLIGLLLVTN